MSWTGPVAGAAPYPQQPYTNSQSGYNQQRPYQYGQQPAYGQYPPGSTYPAPGPPQRPPNIQLPKKKGNPIITRYPPPPGYRGPAQTQGPFGANQYSNQYQSPQSGYPQAASTPSTYPNQTYTAPPAPQGYSPSGYGPPHPPAYPQQPYHHAQNYQWPQQGYQPNSPYPPGHLGGQAYAPPTSSFANYHPQPAPADPIPQSYRQPLGWPPFNGQGPSPPNNQHVSYNGPAQIASQGLDPNVTPTPISAHLLATQASQAASQQSSAVEESSITGKSQLFLAWDDWDFDFEGAIWPKSNEPVDPNLSLGVIIWHPAKQVTRALPSTFDAAEESALRPAPEKLDNGESVSVYFMAENSHEAFLDVRQTDEWESIRDDPIFVVFTEEEMRRNLVSLEDCIAQRDRPDEHVADTHRDDDEEMPDILWNVMNHLEQELSSANGAPGPKAVEHQRLSPARCTQEEILAKLGVTGAPKPPSDGPLPPRSSGFDDAPILLPEKQVTGSSLPLSTQLPPPRAQPSHIGERDSGSSRAPPRPYCSTFSRNSSRQPVPPPPPPPESEHCSSWNQPHHNNRDHDAFQGSPARSESSNHTMVGSDFGPEKHGGSPEKEDSAVPVLTRSDSSFSRKRSYEDTDHGDEKSRQQDDHTKRKRRSQVDAAYSRR